MFSLENLEEKFKIPRWFIIIVIGGILSVGVIKFVIWASKKKSKKKR